MQPMVTDTDRILEDVRRALERSPWEARAALRLVTLLGASAEARSGSARGGLAPRDKRKVEDYFREHLAQPLQVAELARQVALSVSYFHRAFRQSFGTTPHRHLIRLRLALAQQLMSTTTMPLSQVALTCGLADQAHLSKLFRRWLNDRPSAWRRRAATWEHLQESPDTRRKESASLPL